MSDNTCEICKKEDDLDRTFRTKYGLRMHMLNVHGLKERDGRWRKVRGFPIRGKVETKDDRYETYQVEETVWIAPAVASIGGEGA